MSKHNIFLVAALSVLGGITAYATYQVAWSGSSHNIWREACLVRKGVPIYTQGSGTICVKRDAIIQVTK